MYCIAELAEEQLQHGAIDPVYLQSAERSIKRRHEYTAISRDICTIAAVLSVSVMNIEPSTSSIISGYPGLVFLNYKSSFV